MSGESDDKGESRGWGKSQKLTTLWLVTDKLWEPQLNLFMWDSDFAQNSGNLSWHNQQIVVDCGYL